MPRSRTQVTYSCERQQKILLKMADHKRKGALPEIKRRQPSRFCHAQGFIQDRASAFGKEYLRRPVSEIRATRNRAEIPGSKAV